MEGYFEDTVIFFLRNHDDQEIHSNQMALSNILSFTLPETAKGYAPAFQEIAEELFNNYMMVIGPDACKFRLCEVEFYYIDETHEDVFTHCDEQQQSLGNWYFHRTGDSFKNGTYKGLDITFGRGEVCIFYLSLMYNIYN